MKNSKTTILVFITTIFVILLFLNNNSEIELIYQSMPSNPSMIDKYLNEKYEGILKLLLTENEYQSLNLMDFFDSNHLTTEFIDEVSEKHWNYCKKCKYILAFANVDYNWDGCRLFFNIKPTTSNLFLHFFSNMKKSANCSNKLNAIAYFLSQKLGHTALIDFILIELSNKNTPKGRRVYIFDLFRILLNEKKAFQFINENDNLKNFYKKTNQLKMTTENLYEVVLNNKDFFSSLIRDYIQKKNIKRLEKHIKSKVETKINHLVFNSKWHFLPSTPSLKTNDPFRIQLETEIENIANQVTTDNLQKIKPFALKLLDGNFEIKKQNIEIDLNRVKERIEKWVCEKAGREIQR